MCPCLVGQELCLVTPIYRSIQGTTTCGFPYLTLANMEVKSIGGSTYIVVNWRGGGVMRQALGCGLSRLRISYDLRHLDSRWF